MPTTAAAKKPATPKAKATGPATIEIAPIRTRSIELTILGRRPVILNRMSEKARRELLFPFGGRKTPAQRAASLKHDPLVEFRESPYTLTDPEAPTLLAHVAGAFKGAAMSAALRMPGATKTEIGQLSWVEGDLIPIWGVPELFMAIVRSADMNKTPDVRTRLIIPEWTATITVTFVSPNINEVSIVNLFAGAGILAGIGDWRPEKLKGTYGQFTLVDPDDERVLAIREGGGRQAQIAAMADPVCYDKETADLFDWFSTELVARGRAPEPLAAD